jgi:hypothetical protein
MACEHRSALSPFACVGMGYSRLHGWPSPAQNHLHIVFDVERGFSAYDMNPVKGKMGYSVRI